MKNPRRGIAPRTFRVPAKCESCHYAPVTRVVAMPAMPDFEMGAAEFALCTDCADFAEHLAEHAIHAGTSL